MIMLEWGAALLVVLAFGGLVRKFG